MKISQQGRKKLKKEEEEDLLIGNGVGVNMFTLGGIMKLHVSVLELQCHKNN